MKLFNAHKFGIEVLDEEIIDSEDLADMIKEAILMYCEVRCVTVEIVDYEENVFTTDTLDFADA